ncbi:MAG: hypothetical protein K6G60_03355 [Lachnospiraceae bacterium]|nr:hypothetical protein [Lachnospiraceae bacterium]
MAAVLIGTLLLGGCQKTAAPELKPSVKGGTDTEKATVKDISEAACGVYTAVCTTEELKTGVGGYFKEMFVTRGDSVKKGDLLATVSFTPVAEKQEEEMEDEPDFDLQLRKIDYAIASEAYEILLNKKEKGENYERDLDIARIDKELALIALKEKGIGEKDAGLETTDLKKEETGQVTSSEVIAEEKVMEIRAPFDGKIVYRAPFVYGDKVDADYPLFAVSGGETYLLGDYIYEADLKGDVKFYAYVDGERLELEKYPYSAADYIARRARFKVPENSIETGSTVGVFVESILKKDALCIPIDAVKADSEGYYCIVIKDGENLKKQIKIGSRTSAVAEILEGLEENDEVVVSTVSRTATGTKTGTARFDTFSKDNSYVGTPEFNNTTLYFNSDDMVFDGFFIDEGQRVKKGEALARCVSKSSGKTLEELEQELSRVTEKIERFETSAKTSRTAVSENMKNLPAEEKKLAELKILRIDTECEKNVFNLKIKKTELEKETDGLKGRIASEVLKAPMDGVVDKLAYVSEGSAVGSDRWMVMMHSEEEEFISVTDRDGVITAGVKVSVQANGNEFYDGTVVQSDSVLEGKGKIGKAYILLDDASVELSGLHNIVVIVKDPVIEHVLLIPRAALMVAGNREYVLVAADGVCKKRYVTTGPSNGEYYCILNGISEGDEVVIQ